MITISFTTPVNVVLRPQNIIPEISENLPSMEVIEMIDNPVTKKVIITVKGTGTSRYTKRLTLWEGAAYDTIGQWTDTDVINRIKEIYSPSPSA